MQQDDVGKKRLSESDIEERKSKLTKRAEDVDLLKAGKGDTDPFGLEHTIPVAHQVELGGHRNAVSCLSLPAAGNRVITGSLDCKLNMYDFGGMDR